MEALKHSLNYELPQELHFDKYAQHILENSRTPNLADTTTIALASSPSITSLDAPPAASASSSHLTTTSEILQKLGASLIHSIQLQSFPRANSFDSSFPGTVHKISSAASASSSSVSDMDMQYDPHNLIMDSHNYNNAMDELQKQLDYDKLMNEVWIGVVLTLILISMIFCFCSCFLYHQFRVWKRSYCATVISSHTDMEAANLNLDLEDPIPEYTLVSGLPSYEAALELLHKNPQSCLIVPPSVFEVFNKNEKLHSENSTTTNTEAAAATEISSAPLLTNNQNHSDTKSILPSYNEATATVTPTAALTYNHSLASLFSLATQKSTQSKSKSNTSAPGASEAEKQFKV